MTDLRQAAQQALEALEAITRSVQSDHQAEIAEDAITALRTALEQQAEPVVDCPRCGHVCSQRPWVGLTDEDWEHIDNKKGTALDTFTQGAVWAEVQLRERNT